MQTSIQSNIGAKAPKRAKIFFDCGALDDFEMVFERADVLKDEIIDPFAVLSQEECAIGATSKHGDFHERTRGHIFFEVTNSRENKLLP